MSACHRDAVFLCVAVRARATVSRTGAQTLKGGRKKSETQTAGFFIGGTGEKPRSASARQEPVRQLGLRCSRYLIRRAGTRAGFLPPLPPRRERCRTYQKEHTKELCRSCYAAALSELREARRSETPRPRKSSARNAARHSAECCTPPPLISHRAKQPVGCGACSGLFGARRYKQPRQSAGAVLPTTRKCACCRTSPFCSR